jgi:hypothetical protein
MKRGFEAYFEEKVLPLIAREHPELVSEMSIRVEGSLGLGLDDELSDLDATLFLPERLWKERGGQLQLTLLHKLEPFLAHPYSGFSRDPYTWPDFRHSEISVHSWGELLCGQAESVLAGEKDVPWEEVSMEELLQLQIHLPLRDAHGVLTRLRGLTAPDRYPPRLWAKGVLGELVDLAGEPEALEKAVRRNQPLEAHMILGDILPKLFRIAFLTNRQYYSWRRCFPRMLKELPAVPGDLIGEFETVGSDADWSEKSAAISRIVQMLTREILESGMLTADMLTFSFAATSEKAWENPNWFDRVEARGRLAERAGYDWLDGWIWDRWGWPQQGEVP